MSSSFARFAARRFSSSAQRRVAINRPAPPPLPPREQREFEDLLRAAQTPAAPNSSGVLQEGDELHPDARRRPSPDFQGDTNPQTGEVGGPKKEPVTHGDWSFGGRATDF